MKYERLIHMQMVIDMRVYLDVIRGLIESQKADILDVLDVSL